MSERRELLAVATALALYTAMGGAALAQDKIKPVEFITGSPTGGWFPVAAAMSELTNRYYEGQPLSVIPSAGAVANVVRVGRGQSEFGISYAPFLKLGIEGKNEMFKDPYPDLKAVFAGTFNMLHFVVSKDSAIKTAAEIKSLKPKLRVGTGPTGSTELFSSQALMAALDLNLKSFETWGGRVELLTTAGRSDGWMNRQLDLAVFFINPPAADVVEMINARPANILSLDENLRNQLAQKWGYGKMTLPKGTYPGQTEDVQTLGMPYIIFAHAKTDPTLVYRLTKSTAENKAKLAAVSSSYQEWEPKEMHQNLGIELHPGAARYYKEVGLIK